mmetsp:Transcript_8671/g.16674  ORF Transcript_8671/g.16674 Transcript_8671/m.16674 type:complete len:281 (+) Transcript_8671:147-989(+)|eukprot:scaffold152_cov163-Amphora_coffeaeformis.AAC.2
MSRYAHATNIAVAVCDATLKKEEDLREHIRDNAQLCRVSAPRLRQDGGEVEELLMQMVEYMDDESVLSKEQITAFLQEQRDALKKVAEMNVHNNRNLDVFFSAVRTLKQVETDEFDAERTEEEGGDAGERLRHFYKEKKREQEDMELDMSQEKIYRDVCEALGEKVGGGAEDDEVEMMYNAASQRTALSCPLTTTLVEDPYKNKACGHVYSKEAIMNYIRQMQSSHRTCKCPVTGCSNTNVTMDQLEPDLVTANLVKRELRRLDHEKVHRMTQDIESDDE